MTEGPQVAECEVCGDVIPVKSSGSGDVRPVRSGESCECGEEAFRLLSEAEVDELSAERLSGRGTR